MSTHTNPSDFGVDDNETGDVHARAQEAAGQVQEKAQAAAGQAQAKLREQLDRRSSQLAEQMTQQSSDLRSVSRALREQGKDSPAQAADRLAGYAEKVGGICARPTPMRCSATLRTSAAASPPRSRRAHSRWDLRRRRS